MEKNASVGRRARGLRFALAGLCLAAATQAWAQVDDERHLFGDWGGHRGALLEKGIDLAFGYDSAIAHNVSGGDRSVTRYADNWSMQAGLDLEKLWGWDGATFKMVYTQRNGRNAGDDANLGIYGSVQELYGRGQTLLLTRMWFEKKLFDDRMRWKIGRVNMDDDFALAPCNFQSLQLCSTQPGQLYGSYFINWPLSVWGTRLRWDVSDRIHVQTGAYQVNPQYVDERYQRSDGWWPDMPGGTAGVLVPLELVWTPSIHGLPGRYAFGVFNSSAGGDDIVLDVDGGYTVLSGLPAREHSNAYGGYVTFAQQISGDAGGHGATLVLRATQGDRHTSGVINQITVSLEQKGVFGRARDGVGLGVSRTAANPRLADAARAFNLVGVSPELPILGAEYSAEVYYNWSPVAWLDLRPNLQYFRNPGADGSRDNPFVVGLKTSVRF